LVTKSPMCDPKSLEAVCYVEVGDLR
jgi:hypothetical protein